MSERQVVSVKYTHDELFVVPKGIDLKGGNFKSWFVKYNRLFIYFIDDTYKVVDSQGCVDNFDFKWPDSGSEEILSPQDVGIDIDEEEEEECSSEKK